MIPGSQRRVAVVVLTWNAIAFTRRCLESLETTNHPSWRLVVVDNGSTDGTPEWLAGRSGVTLLRNRTNLGFTRAVNQGITSCAADEDIVLMNNDTRVTDPGWLTRLQEVAYADPATGVVGTRLVDGSGTIIHLGSYMQPITLRGQQSGGLEVDINQARRDRPVESVVFAQAYLRRDCIDVVGLLDEDLFAYFEDTDYCLRAEQAGFSVVFAGSINTVHNQSTTTRENKVDFWSVYNRSQKVFERKWARWVEHDRYQAEVVWHSVLHRPLGYAVQSRKLMSAMHFSDLRVSYRNAYGDSDGPTGDLLLDDLMRREPDPNATHLAFCQADAFARVAGRRRVGWSMLEVTGLPEEWVRGANTMDEVWVPASFNVESFTASGVRVPIHVMPLGVDVDYFNPGIAAFRPSESFTFLSVFEWGERKAPEVLLRAYAEEFKESEDVLLMLSVFNRDPMVDPQREIAAMDLPACPPIVLMINPEITGYQMGSLYRSADCFVAPSRGEGWGMTVLEAMACGLPTIATGWGGPADFLNETNGYPLNWRLAPAQARCPYYEGFDWAEPDLEHLRFLMREIVDNPEAARARGQVAAAEVAERWTWQQSAARVRARMLELG